MKRRFGPFLLLATALSPVSTGYTKGLPPSASTGVVEISSEYTDECTGKVIRETGTAIVLREAGPNSAPYLVTTSHLTQGRNLTINGQPAQSLIKRRLADNLVDGEAMELDPKRFPASPFGQFDIQAGKITAFPDKVETWTSKEGRTLPVATPSSTNTRAPFALIPEWSRSDMVEPQDNKSVAAFGLSNIERKTGPYIKETSKNELIRQAEIAYLAIGGQVVAPGRVAPGMSGGPLIDPESDSQIIQGLASEFISEMKGSYFVSDREVLKLLNQLKAGKTGRANQTVWRQCNGITYKDMGSGKKEIVRRTQSSGNGAYTPPGNGAYTPPGNGAYTPPGARESNNTRESGIDSTFMWNGKIGTMFKVQLRPGTPPIYLPPITSSFVLANLLEKAGKKVEVVPTHARLLDLLNQKIGGERTHSKDFRVGTESEVLCMRKSPEIERVGDKLKITLYGNLPEQEPIYLVLDAQGRQIDPKSGNMKSTVFRPRIEVTGMKSGRTYIVELGELFFTDLSNIVFRPGDERRLEELEKKLSSGNAQTVVSTIESLIAEYRAENKAFLSYREKGKRAQYRFEFSFLGPRRKPAPGQDPGCPHPHLLEENINLLRDPDPLCEISDE